MTTWSKHWAGVAAAALLCASCHQELPAERTLRSIGPEKFRTQTLTLCREGFSVAGGLKIDAASWPEAVRAFQPLGLWAEPDGAYLLIESDAEGEQGLFVPRLESEEDPVCSPKLQHRKLGTGVYWYERRR